MNQDIANLIKHEETCIMHDIFDHIPIKGILHLLIQFISITVKREWRIEKLYRDKIYPVDINNIKIEKSISFDICDHALTTNDVLLLSDCGGVLLEDILSYDIFYRYSIGIKSLEDDLLDTVCLKMRNVIWIDDHDDSDYDDYYITHIKDRNVIGITVDIKNDIYIEHTKDNCIFSNQIILSENKLPVVNYEIRDVVGIGPINWYLINQILH